MRVLIVDDSKTMRKIERSVLVKLGYEDIEEAVNGQDAMSKVAAFKPDLILLDWNMPIMDGITFLRNLRAKDTATRVIMVTTESEKSRVIEAIKAGVNNYAVKPFTPDSISKIIETTMANAA